jgi:hypothetical protein
MMLPPAEMRIPPMHPESASRSEPTSLSALLSRNDSCPTVGQLTANVFSQKKKF